MSLIPNQEPEDRELSNYKLETPSTEFKRAQKLKQKLEGSHVARVVLILLAIVGTSMVIGDGILTPSISGFKINYVYVNKYIQRNPGTSLVVQWRRIYLPMQGTWFNPWSGKVPHAMGN